MATKYTFCNTSLSILDGYYQRFQASVHIPLTSTIDKSRKIKMNLRECKARWVKSKNSTFMLCIPPHPWRNKLFSLSINSY